MTPEDAIRRAVAGEEVRFESDLLNFRHDKNRLLKAALRWTSEPIEITALRYDDATRSHYFLVRRTKMGELINDRGELV